MIHNKLALPTILQELIQNAQDSASFALCFNADAEVYDEGQIHKGQEAIKAWNEYANQKYDTKIQPIDFVESNPEDILKVQVSGNFDGSPITLRYHLVIKNQLITRLSIDL
jgi:hypothetical protein